jgi:transposase InsO family protein
MFGGVMSKEARARLRWMDHYRKSGNARLTCRHFAISPTTFYRWLKRFMKAGLRGLENRSRAPKRRRVSGVAWQTVELIVSLRKEHPAWSKHKIAVLLRRDYGISLSSSTVGRILKRKGLYDTRATVKRRRAAKRARRRQRAARWMRDAFPGSLVQIDTKHLPWLGYRCYQFTAVDCFSRLSFSRVYSSASSLNAKRFLAEMLDFFPFPVSAVQTDNGSEYLGDFDRALAERGIEHYFSHPHCPKENARVERKIQTTKYELWALREGYSVAELNQVVDEWNYDYNWIRPHQSLGYLTPMEFLRQWMEESKDRVDVFTM